MKTFLDQILADVRDELSTARLRRTPADLRGMIDDAPPVRSLAASIGDDFRLIAEIKERSPSVGPMRPENVAVAPRVYEESPVVCALSVLTNALHFGMSIERLTQIRDQVTKPVLRKDFLVDEYQIREARAFGADAVLLMANVLDASRLGGFYDLVRELGMQALFEVHTEEEIALLPPDVRIVGINSRKFKTDAGFVGATGSSETDFSLDFTAFELVDRLPVGVIRIAESGLAPSNIDQFAASFDAGLVGTSLLRDERGPEACLAEFQAQMAGI